MTVDERTQQAQQEAQQVAHTQTVQEIITERDRLRAALDEIAQHDSSEFTPEHRRLIQIARKARAKGTT